MNSDKIILIGIDMWNDKKILLISNTPNTFLKKDKEILSKHYSVDTFIYNKKSDRWKLLKEIPKYEINISWFILGYSQVAVKASRLLNKRSVLIAGGWDVATVPEIGYGYILDPKKKRRLKNSLKNADLVISISKDLKNKVHEIQPACEATLVYHGFDQANYFPSGKKKDKVMTVVSRMDKEIVELKGLKTFVACARSFPDIQFFIIGGYEPKNPDYKKLKKDSPNNVIYTNFLEYKDLLKHYQDAKVYAQLSAQESFGCSLAEAMLCECVPIGTDRGAIPEVVGDKGYLVPYGDIKQTETAIKKALNSKLGRTAKKRIIDNFHINDREEKLLKLIDGL
jgi:glycosyltransferase involved in cell wall biosynthesis